MTKIRWSSILVACGVAALTSCAADAPPSEQLGKQQQPIGSGKDDFGDLKGEHPYVGAIAMAGTKPVFCSGVLVTPRWVLTAAHCVVPLRRLLTPGDPSKKGGEIRKRDVDIIFGSIAEATGLSPGPLRYRHTNACSGDIPAQLDEVDDNNQFHPAKDLALIRLDQRVPMTGPNAIRPKHPAGSNGEAGCANEFDGGVLIGYGPKKLLSAEALDPTRNFKSSGGWSREAPCFPGGACASGEYNVFRNSWVTVFESYGGILGGDSGGALLNDTGRLCGINSRHYPWVENLSPFPLPPFIVVKEVTDNPALDAPGNVSFVKRIVADGRFEGECNATGDPVRDDMDTDGDGVPDPCDKCPFVFNPAQEDICHVCPGDDSDDRDGVGASCDNCAGSYNPVKVCRSDFECRAPASSGLPDQKCVFAKDPSPGACATFNKNPYGRCAATALEKRTDIPCTRDEDCPIAFGDTKGTCFDLRSWGRCSGQVDDTDGDGLGDRCDNCSKVAGRDVQRNSNKFAEDRETTPIEPVDHLGDRCDEVPNMVSLPLATPTKFTPKTGDPLLTTTHLAVTDGIGTDGPARATTALAAVVSGKTDNRQCHCVVTDPTSATAADECLISGRCPSASDSFLDSRWRVVTLGTSRTVAPTSPGAIRTGVAFNDFVDCSDKRYSPQNFDGPCRVGVPRDLVWWQSLDTARSSPTPVVSIGGDFNATSGVFWSKVVSTNPPDVTTSLRDGSTAGHLRDHYAFIATPLWVLVPELKHDPVPPWRRIKLCFGPCDPEFNIDLIDRRKIIFEPSNAASTLVSSAYLFAKDGKVFGVREATVATGGVDLTTSFSPAVRSLLSTPDTLWVRPVESGDRARSSGRGVVLAATPKTWSTTASVAAIGVTPTGSIDLVPFQSPNDLPPSQTSLPEDSLKTAKAGGTSAPSAAPVGARTGAAPILSSTEGALYLVGGKISDSHAGDVWRFDFARNAWSSIAMGDVVLEEVIAATYDPDRGKLVVLDEITKGSGKTSKFVRFSVIDTRAGTARVAATLPRSGVYDQIGMSLLDRGAFALVGQRDGAPTWQSFRFELTSKDDIRWTGFAEGNGELFDVARVTGPTVHVRIRLPDGSIDSAKVLYAPSSSSKTCDQL